MASKNNTTSDADIQAQAWNALIAISETFCDGDFDKAYDSIPNITETDSITERARKTVEFAEWLDLDVDVNSEDY